MQQEVVYSHQTRTGTLWIVVGLDRRWHVIFDGEDLGGYESAEDAASRIAENANEFVGLHGSVQLPRSLSGWVANVPTWRAGARLG